MFGAGVEEVVDLAGEIAFQAADGLEFGVAFGGLLRDVGLGSRVEPEAADHGEVEGAVGLSVASAVEAVPVWHSG